MRTNSRFRALAWLCVVVVLLAAASPVTGGLSPAILAPAGPWLGQLVALGLPPTPENAPPPDRPVLRGVAARAPPLA